MEFSSFDRNHADQNGGVIYLSNTNSLIIDSKFNQNTAEKGGVIFIDQVNKKDNIVEKCSFQNNLAMDEGAIFYWSHQPGRISKNEYNNNICRGMANTNIFEPEGLQLILPKNEVNFLIYQRSNQIDFNTIDYTKQKLQTFYQNLPMTILNEFNL